MEILFLKPVITLDVSPANKSTANIPGLLALWSPWKIRNDILHYYVGVPNCKSLIGLLWAMFGHHFSGVDNWMENIWNYPVRYCLGNQAGVGTVGHLSQLPLLRSLCMGWDSDISTWFQGFLWLPLSSENDSCHRGLIIYQFFIIPSHFQIRQSF